MPYDAAKSRALINTGKAYERLPGSDFVLELVKQLQEADNEMRDFAQTMGAKDLEVRQYKQLAQDERDALKRFREKSGPGFDAAVDALREIAAAVKGGKKIAQDALDKLFPKVPDPMPSLEESESAEIKIKIKP